MKATAPKRTSLDRAIERKQNLANIVCSIWFEAYRRGELHSWILEQTQSRVYGHPSWVKLPRWAQSEVQATGMAMLQAAQGWMLSNVWLHEGIAYGNDWNKLPENVRELIRQDKLQLVTVWSEYSARFVDRAADTGKLFSGEKSSSRLLGGAR